MHIYITESDDESIDEKLNDIGEISETTKLSKTTLINFIKHDNFLFVKNYLDEIAIQSKYFCDIFEELCNDNNFRDLVDSKTGLKLYLFRIWSGINNCYLYKLGSTKNLKMRVTQLNNEFGCNCKIILVFVMNIDLQSEENELHNLLQTYRYNNTIDNNFYKKSRETYNITSNFYNNLFNKINEKYGENSYFQSEDYNLTNDDNEEMKLYGSINYCNLPIDDDDYCDLDKNHVEEKYWIMRKLKFYNK